LGWQKPEIGVVPGGQRVVERTRKQVPSGRQQARTQEIEVHGTPWVHAPLQLAWVVWMQKAEPKGQHAPMGGQGLKGVQV